MKIEWRPNTSVGGAIVEFVDLFIDDMYQSIWVERARNTGKWALVVWGSPNPRYQSPEFDTMEEAQAHLTTYNVIRRLEGQT